MKKLLLFFVTVITVIICTTSCNNIDPIWGTDPVDTTYATGFPIDQFHQLGIAGDTAGQRALVDQYRKQLTMNVINNHYPCIKDEKNIHFVFGSGNVKGMMSGDGKQYDGRFNNELIIILNDSCIKDTLFLACGNGVMYEIYWDNMSDWGTAEKCRFEILEGQGLAHHLPELQAWADVAGELDIPIRDKEGKIVGRETYLSMLGRYESVLFPGDVIDMCQQKVFNKAGQEVQFDRRLEETRKANKAHKKGKKRR